MKEFEHKYLKKPVPIISSVEELEEFISSRIKDDKIQTLEDFNKLNNLEIKGNHFLNLEKGVSLIKDMIQNQKRIKFINDSDVDGLGTNVLTYRFFKDYIPYPVKIDITDRKQGYGFLPLHIDPNDLYDLYVTADNGITAVEATNKAHQYNSKVIITDHHMPEEAGIPEADAIIDPMLKEDKFEYKEISGTVVLFFFLRELLRKYYPGNNEILERWFYDSIDMMGLTTISDVMPLDNSLNRFIVKKFIEEIHNKNIRFTYLKTFTENVTDKPLATDFAFGIIPALNATNRMTSAIEGFTFLIQESLEDSQKWYNYIIDLNNARKAKQQELLTYIEKYYKDWIKGRDFILIPGKFKSEYKGVLGIIAGRLAEKYKRPCIVLNLDDKGVYSGSGRSVGDLNILDIFREIKEKHPEWIEHVGGHKVALGIGIKQEYINDIFSYLQEKLKEFPKEIFQSKKEANFFISLNDLSILDLDLYDDLLKFEPFGQRFEKPVFITKARVQNVKTMGKQKNHMSFVLTDKSKYIKIKALWFFFDETKSNFKEDEEYYFIWQPDIEEYPKGSGNRKLVLRIIDVLL